MVLAQDAAVPGQGVFVQLPGGLVLAKRGQVIGEAVGGGQGVRVVLAQDAAAPGQGVFVQLPGLVVAAQGPQDSGQGGRRAQRALGETQAARELDEDTLARRRRLLGEDHPSTLTSASNLAVDLHDLGETQAARELDEDTLARRRRLLGEDHPDTLGSASNLAVDLRALGETEDRQART